MKWFQAVQQQLSQHKYAINAKILGDTAAYAWTNLGYWTVETRSYPQACCQLADQLAHAVDLNSKDKLLDLGCGQGASLFHWKNNYNIQDISAVDVQMKCIELLQENLNSKIKLYCASFLNLKQIFADADFDVVLCIDAAYHSHLNSFLHSAYAILNSKGRLGFHYLMLSEKWQQLSHFEQRKYRYLLKSADIHIQHLADQKNTEYTLAACGFEHIQIVDFSEQVLHGFSHYIQQGRPQATQTQFLDDLKIQMTARLCEKLFKDGLVRYVQISAHKAA